MNQKTQGVEVEEKPSPVAVFYSAGASNVGQASMLASVRAADQMVTTKRRCFVWPASRRYAVVSGYTFD